MQPSNSKKMQGQKSRLRSEAAVGLFKNCENPANRLVRSITCATILNDLHPKRSAREATLVLRAIVVCSTVRFTICIVRNAKGKVFRWRGSKWMDLRLLYAQCSGMPIAAPALDRWEMLAVLGLAMRRSRSSQIDTQQHCRVQFRYFALASCRSKERAEISKRPVYGSLGMAGDDAEDNESASCPKA